MTRVSTVVTVQDGSQVSEARRAASACATALAMSETDVGRAALAATELATNLIKHAGGGELIIGPNLRSIATTLDLVAIDKGPGIANIDAALRDGYSTAGSSGTGLGALQRLASSFDVYSRPGKGTAILLRLGSATTPSSSLHYVVAPPRLTIAGVCVAKRGEPIPGDSWTVVRTGETTTVMIADGLGHGPMASEASVRAVVTLQEMRPDESLDEIVDAMHGALRATRGAAVGIARIEPLRRKVAFLGVGNIAGSVVDDGARSMISHNGIVGHQMRKKGEFAYPWSDSALLVLASDGLGTSWNLNDYPGLANRDPGLIAAVLYRDYTRGTDDTTVVVAKGAP